MLPRELPTGRPLTLLGFEFCVFPLLVMIAHAAVELAWKAPGTRLGSAHRPASTHSPPPPHGPLGPIRAPRLRGQLQPSALCVFDPVSPTGHTWPTIFVVVTCHNQGWLTRSNASAYPPGLLMGPPPGCLVTAGDGVSLWPTILIVGAVKSQHIIVSERGQLASRRQIQRRRGGQVG